MHTCYEGRTFSNVLLVRPRSSVPANASLLNRTTCNSSEETTMRWKGNGFKAASMRAERYLGQGSRIPDAFIFYSNSAFDSNLSESSEIEILDRFIVLLNPNIF